MLVTSVMAQPPFPRVSFPDSDSAVAGLEVDTGVHTLRVHCFQGVSPVASAVCDRGVFAEFAQA